MDAAKHLFFCLLVLLPLLGFSQENVLKRKIDFEAKDQRLENVLLGIANVGDFSFSYNPLLIPGDSLISLNVVNSTINDVLGIIFLEKITYKVSGNHLILLKNKPVKVKESIKYSVSGYVYDATTGSGLPATTIYEVYTLTSAITDERGYYSLDLTNKFDVFGLAFSKREFVDTLVMIQPANRQIDVPLRQKWSGTEMDFKRPEFKASVKSLDDISIVRSFVPSDQILLANNTDIIEHRPAQISFLPIIGTNAKMSGSIANSFSVNVLAGYSAGVKVLEIGGLVNINKRHVSGLQAAGLSNVVGGRTRGLQLAGLSNNNRGSLYGLQLAGISNMVVDTIRGVQVAGISNILQGGMRGWQIAGISNVTTKNVDGVQISGISNFASGDVELMQIAGIINMGRNVNGMQIAGLINASQGTVGGAQLSGIANIAQQVNTGQLSGIFNISTKQVKGAQVAAIVNYGKNIRGSQIALINLSDTVSGLPIGLISFVRKGYRRMELAANEIFPANLTFKTGVRKFHNVFTASVRPMKNSASWSFGYGVGFESSIGKKILQSLDYTAFWILEEEKPFGTFNLLNRLNINYAYLLGKRTCVFAGPSVNVHLSTWTDPDNGAYLTKIAPYAISTTVIGDTQMQLWLGGQMGFRF